MKTKQIIFTTTFFLWSLFISAQEKYDFINIISDSYSKAISISLNGSKFTIENLEWTKGEKFNANFNPVFKKINNYQNEGWEVISLNSISQNRNSPDGETHFNHIAFLRKKKSDTK